MPLTNTQYDEIMRTYEKRQLDRQQLIDERKRNLPGLIRNSQRSTAGLPDPALRLQNSF